MLSEENFKADSSKKYSPPNNSNNQTTNIPDNDIKKQGSFSENSFDDSKNYSVPYWFDLKVNSNQIYALIPL